MACFLVQEVGAVVTTIATKVRKILESVQNGSISMDETLVANMINHMEAKK